MRARDGGKVRIPQLELDRWGAQAVFAQTAPYHLAEPRQRRLDLRHIRRVLVKGVFVADGFRSFLGADLAVEPAARVQAARFPGQRHPPLAETLFEKCIIQPCQVATLRMPSV